MQMEASDAFDVTKEPKKILKADGPGEQARSLLLRARRLIERGVRFVQVSHGPVQPWDSHENIAKEHKRFAGLDMRQGNRCPHLPDLKRLGLFESTLIVWAASSAELQPLNYPMREP